jgi:osmotically-inducible protein OsmY
VDPATLRGERLGYETDAELAERVHEALEEEGVELGGLEIRVLNSVVTLLGTVPDRQNKRMAAEAAYSVPAVLDVNNQLTIAKVPERGSR